MIAIHWLTNLEYQEHSPCVFDDYALSGISVIRADILWKQSDTS